MLKLVAFGLGLWALSFVALMVNNSFGNVATIWPINAVVFATLVGRPARHWPPILIVAFLANVGGGLSAGATGGHPQWLAATGLSACNIVESLAGTGFLRLIAGPKLDLSRPRDLFLFGIVCLLAPLLSGGLAIGFLALLGRHDLTHAFQAWVLADLLGLVVVAPAMLLARFGSLAPLFSKQQRWTTLAALAAQAGLISVVCMWDMAGLRSLIFAAFVIPAFALGTTGAALGALLGSLVVLGFAVTGPAFAHLSGGELVRQASILQAFLAMTNLLAIGFAATQQARRTAEAKLAESELGFRQIAENTRDLILKYDLGGTITYASPSALALGYRPEDLIGRNMGEFTHPDDDAAARANRQSLARGQMIDRATLPMTRARRGDGEWAWLEGVGVPFYDSKGEIVGVVTVLRDVTLRVAMEVELRTKSVEAEAGALAKSEFLANMSHEIRTPLTGVLGFAGLLQALPDLSPAGRSYADRISTSGQALLTVVNDILDFSKLEANRIDLDPHPFSPAAFVIETVDLVAAQAKQKGLAITTEIEGELPAAVLADSGRIRQVLLNLLSNAIKFTSAGQVAVTVSYRPESGGDLGFAVADSGIGISTDQLGRLFQRFSQVDSSNTRLHGGTGLGLAISKSLVELMGGRIGVESREGEGSTFRFTVAAPPVEPSHSEPVAADPPVAAHAAEARILVVDDLAMNRELVRTMRAPFDYDITEAANGADAVRSALSDPFDLILMDLQMPGMDGLAATRAIRATSDLNRLTPIVALSANVLPVHIAECRDAGMDDHIAKPISPAELLTKIANWTQLEEADPLQSAAR